MNTNKYITHAYLELLSPIGGSEILENVLQGKVKVTFPLTISYGDKLFKVSNRHEVLLFKGILSTTEELLSQPRS